MILKEVKVGQFFEVVNNSSLGVVKRIAAHYVITGGQADLKNVAYLDGTEDFICPYAQVDLVARVHTVTAYYPGLGSDLAYSSEVLVDYTTVKDALKYVSPNRAWKLGDRLADAGYEFRPFRAGFGWVAWRTIDVQD